MPKIEEWAQGIEWGKKEMPEIKNALNTLNIWI